MQNRNELSKGNKKYRITETKEQNTPLLEGHFSPPATKELLNISLSLPSIDESSEDEEEEEYHAIKNNKQNTPSTTKKVQPNFRKKNEFYKNMVLSIPSISESFEEEGENYQAIENNNQNTSPFPVESDSLSSASDSSEEGEGYISENEKRNTPITIRRVPSSRNKKSHRTLIKKNPKMPVIKPQNMHKEHESTYFDTQSLSITREGISSEAEEIFSSKDTKQYWIDIFQIAIDKVEKTKNTERLEADFSKKRDVRIRYVVGEKDGEPVTNECDLIDAVIASRMELNKVNEIWRKHLDRFKGKRYEEAVRISNEALQVANETYNINAFVPEPLSVEKPKPKNFLVTTAWRVANLLPYGYLLSLFSKANASTERPPTVSPFTPAGQIISNLQTEFNNLLDGLEAAGTNLTTLTDSLCETPNGAAWDLLHDVRSALSKMSDTAEASLADPMMRVDGLIRVGNFSLETDRITPQESLENLLPQEILNNSNSSLPILSTTTNLIKYSNGVVSDLFSLMNELSIIKSLNNTVESLTAVVCSGLEMIKNSTAKSVSEEAVRGSTMALINAALNITETINTTISSLSTALYSSTASALPSVSTEAVITTLNSTLSTLNSTLASLTTLNQDTTSKQEGSEGISPAMMAIYLITPIVIVVGSAVAICKIKHTKKAVGVSLDASSSDNCDSISRVSDSYYDSSSRGSTPSFSPATQRRANLFLAPAFSGRIPLPPISTRDREITASKILLSELKSARY